MSNLKQSRSLIVIAFAAVWLRLINLGYSNLQGDEIKALYRPDVNQGLFDFLLSQKKGPVQFLVTYSLKPFDPSYSNEWLLRFPFALAGLLSVYFFYHLVKLHFPRKIALISTFFLAINGLFVAFSRLVQYQSFVILFSILSLYFLSLSLKSARWRVFGLYVGMACWAIALLAHFDGIFIAPFALYLLYRWIIEADSSRAKSSKLPHLIGSLALFSLILACFYIPFLLSISDSKLSYWTKRIGGKSGDPSTLLFQTYNPLFVIYGYVLLILFSLYQIKDRIKENRLAWAWFLFPFLAMEVVISQPRTHIYTYLLPLCILLAYGVEGLETLTRKIMPKKGRFVNFWVLSLGGIFLFTLSHATFVDHTLEYPWQDKPFLLWTMPEREIKGLFGFPYYRHWDEIGDYLEATAENGYYLTNEKDIIAQHYLPQSWQYVGDTPQASQLQGLGYLIYIHNPQSWQETIWGQPRDYWQQRYERVKTFANGDVIVAEIYRL